MSRQKKQPGRRQRAHRAMVWIAVLLVINIAVNIIPIFPFQARKKMESAWELDTTQVIWEEEKDFGRWDGNYHCLAVNEEVAVFYNTHWFDIYGWLTDVVRFLNKGTSSPLYAEWSGQYSRDYHDTMWFMGYVHSAEVDSIEYQLIWSDDITEVYQIPNEAYLQDGADQYYVYDTGVCMFRDDLARPGHSYMVVEVLVIAKDVNGVVLHEEFIYPSWK